MILVVEHTELLLDDLGHPSTGPDVTTEAIGFCAMREKIRDELFLLFGQAGRCARSRASPQGIQTLLSSCGQPLTDCSWGDSQRFGDVVLFPVLEFQLQSLKSPNLLPVVLRCFLNRHVPLIAWQKKFSNLCIGQ